MGKLKLVVLLVVVSMLMVACDKDNIDYLTDTYKDEDGCEYIIVYSESNAQIASSRTIGITQKVNQPKECTEQAE